MSRPLALSIENAVAHAGAVLGTHGFSSTRDSALWPNPHDLAIPYPNAIALKGPLSASAVLEGIEEFFAAKGDDVSTAVVDSFSRLELGALGMEVLFRDPWLARKPVPVGEDHPHGLEVSQVETAAELDEFDAGAARGFEAPSSERAYLDALLEDASHRFPLGKFEGRTVSGVGSFGDDRSLGIYSLFTPPQARGRGCGGAMIRAAIR